MSAWNFSKYCQMTGGVFVLSESRGGRQSPRTTTKPFLINSKLLVVVVVGVELADALPHSL
jgi:hypothetical protein